MVNSDFLSTLTHSRYSNACDMSIQNVNIIIELKNNKYMFVIFFPINTGIYDRDVPLISYPEQYHLDLAMLMLQVQVHV